MSTRINYTTGGNPLGSQLSNIIRNLTSDRAQLKTLKEAMDSMASGSTWAQIESELGIEAGQGQTVYNIVSGMLAALNTATFDDLARLYKG